ncbi:MAG: FliH/SctL family protein [Jatrophihabitans sp.]
MPDTPAGASFVLTGRAGVPSELVDQARGDARAVGYAQGWAQGVREASELQTGLARSAQAELKRREAEHGDRLASLLQAVDVAASRLDQTVVQLTDQICDQILAAAVELAQSLLGAELRDPVTAASAALTRVLRLAPDNEPVTVWLSPSDYQSLTGPDAGALISAIEAGAAARLSFECDPALADGDALARSAATSIDARLTAAIARLREQTA